MDERALLRKMFDAAVAAAAPALVVPPHLPRAAAGRTIVVGAGKAAASMAARSKRHWPGAAEGLVVTRYGHGAPTTRIEVVEAAPSGARRSRATGGAAHSRTRARARPPTISCCA